METLTVEIQFDEKPMGAVIRINDETGCIFRICQIPKELIFHPDGTRKQFIDLTYPTIQNTPNKN